MIIFAKALVFGLFMLVTYASLDTLFVRFEAKARKQPFNLSTSFVEQLYNNRFHFLFCVLAYAVLSAFMVK